MFTIASGTGIYLNDTVNFSGVTGLSPSSGSGTVTGFSAGPPVVLTVNVASTGSSSGAGTLTGNYMKGTSGNARYDLKVLTQSTSGSWVNPIITNLTPISVRGIFGWSAAGNVCSVGNPDGYTDGTVTYIAFLVQDGSTNNCNSAANLPDGGIYYDLWACNLSAGVTVANMTTSNCAVLLTSNQSTLTLGAFLDPHIWHNGHIYASERCNPGLPAACFSTTTAYWPQWSIDDVPVSWGGGGTHPSITGGSGSVTRYQFGTWGTAQVSNHCEQFFKITSLGDLPSGTVRGFFNANQVKNNYNYSGAGPCVGLGANNFPYDGVFYGDFNGTTSGPGTAVQIYPPYHSSNLNPPATANCLTPNNNIQCYSEFPYVFHDMRRMVFSGSLFTQSWVIDLCAANFAAGGHCQPNFNNDEIQALLAVDYTQTVIPMSITAMTRRTNYNTLGSPMCQQFLYQGGSPSASCGIAYNQSGGCSHLSVDEPTQLLACNMSTTSTSPNTNLPLNETVISPLASTPAVPFLSILYPGAAVFGGAQSQ